MIIEAWMLTLLIKASTFCVEIDTSQRTCVEQLMECYLNDNKQWCEQSFWTYYTGK